MGALCSLPCSALDPGLGTASAVGAQEPHLRVTYNNPPPPNARWQRNAAARAHGLAPRDALSRLAPATKRPYRGQAARHASATPATELMLTFPIHCSRSVRDAIAHSPGARYSIRVIKSLRRCLARSRLDGKVIHTRNQAIAELINAEARLRLCARLAFPACSLERGHTR